MKGLKTNAGIVVFLIFFGTAALEAFRTRNWLNVAYWIGVSLVFAMVNSFTRDPKSTEDAESPQ
jgi:hypothetical protein